MAELPIINEAYTLIDTIVSSGIIEPEKTETHIETLSQSVLNELKTQNLTSGQDDFLLPHASNIMQHIADPKIAGLHLFAE